MNNDTFTFEIVPETQGDHNSAACFHLTLDLGDCAPTFPTSSSGSPTAAGGWSWPHSQPPWNQPAPSTCYYDPYYYNYGYYPVQGASPCIPGSNKNGILTPASGTCCPSSSPLPPAPLVSTSVAQRSSQQAGNKQKDNAKRLQKRVPTPHPRRPSAAAVGTLASTRPKPPSSAVNISSAQRNTVNSDDVSIRYLQKQRESLSERLNRLSLPSKSLAEETKKKASEIVGRPLWSGNFSGANSPAQTTVPCKTKPVIANTSLKSSINDVLESSSKSCEKQAVKLEDVKVAVPQSSIKNSAESSQGTSYSSPIVHYVSYNYRPLVVQSPTCSTGALFDAGGNSTAAAAFGQPRFRTTSTLETHYSTEN